MKAVIYPMHTTEPITQLVRDFPQIEWAVVGSPEELARAIPGATVLLTSNRVCSPEAGQVLREHGRELRWISFNSSGIERGIEMGLPEGVIVTNSTGVKATMVAEHALALLLALVRRVPDILSKQQDRQYLREEINAQLRTLENATICVIGRGAIGREVVRKLKAFDARPIAVSRTMEDAGDVETVYPRERLREALGLSDAVVICTNGDDSTHHLVGGAEFAAMKPNALVVNVARGSIIDEPALVQALQSGHIAGAGLDVAEVEPVPSDSPLWTLPNVIVSPHVAGGGSTGYPMHRKLFAQNLERLAAGAPLLNECRIPGRA